MGTAGIVTAARKEAAEAGASMLAAGGNAADAAVATAFALTVTDPANCGIGGWGGYAIVDLDGRAQPLQIEFNTAVPTALDGADFSRAHRIGDFICGGLSVSRPSVVPGLWHIHERFGRLPWRTVLAPAIKLAGEGFAIGNDLARAFAWARRSPDAFAPEFWRNFVVEGDLTDPVSRLRQPDLRQTLELLAESGAAAYADSPLVEGIVRAVWQAGGILSERDFARLDITDFSADGCTFAGAAIYGPRPGTTGFGVVVDALAAMGNEPWSAERDMADLTRISAALREAWNKRSTTARSLIPSARAIQHTTHFCAADAEGRLLSLTFTHGPLWFGSGLVVPNMGVILNCGANLLIYDTIAGRTAVQSNISPIIARAENIGRYALGTPGGYRIPAVIATALVDVLVFGRSLSEAIASPRIAVNMTGSLEVEAALSAAAPGARIIKREEFYGPASGVTVTHSGELLGALDPRFEGVLARIDERGNVNLSRAGE